MKKALLAFAICLMLCGCREDIKKESEVPPSFMGFYTDRETGVEYVVYQGENIGGICPRYNADGTLYTEGKP